jgi:uncharacterized protein YkwD
MKKWIVGLIFVIAAVLFWHFVLPKESQVGQIPGDVKNFASSTLSGLQNASQNISVPAPLKSLVQNPNSLLTDSGVISWTNTNRQQNGNLPALTENSVLDQEAAAKLADMFKQQYFEHVNPQGHGPDYLAKTYGYAYISIGENLALGNFKNDQDLLTAWMNSPGHRANILNVKYREIGVAVGQGMYQGEKTWLAVQEFGEPASVCPSVNLNLKTQIVSLQAEVDQDGAQLTAEKAQIDSANPQTQSDYNIYNAEVADYNNKVAIYNNEVDTLKLDTSNYNAEVTAFNSCAGV